MTWPRVILAITQTVISKARIQSSELVRVEASRDGFLPQSLTTPDLGCGQATAVSSREAQAPSALLLSSRSKD